MGAKRRQKGQRGEPKAGGWGRPEPQCAEPASQASSLQPEQGSGCTRVLGSGVSLQLLPPPTSPRPSHWRLSPWTRTAAVDSGSAAPSTGFRASLCPAEPPGPPTHTPHLPRGPPSAYGIRLFMGGSFNNGTRSAWASSTRAAANTRPNLGTTAGVGRPPAGAGAALGKRSVWWKRFRGAPVTSGLAHSRCRRTFKYSNRHSVSEG